MHVPTVLIYVTNIVKLDCCSIFQIVSSLYIVIECVLPPGAHKNGKRSGSGISIGSTFTYSCNEGYNLQGNATITCMANRQWSGMAPSCSGKLLCSQMSYQLIGYQVPMAVHQGI